LLLVTDTNGSENDEKSLPGILGQEKMEVPDPSITMTSGGSVGGEEGVRAHG
jgi:hypothetical protein